MRPNLLTKIAFPTLLLASSVTLAAEWTFLPYQDSDWSPDFTLAAATGSAAIDSTTKDKATGVSGSDSSTETINGLQLSLNCPWFSPPSGNIRQQFNYNSFSDSDGDLTFF